jgi:hypothetical protein
MESPATTDDQLRESKRLLEEKLDHRIDHSRIRWTVHACGSRCIGELRLSLCLYACPHNDPRHPS